MATKLDAPTHKSVWLVHLEWGDPVKHLRITDWETDYTFGGDVFTSLPSLEIELPPNTGTLQDHPASIVVPSSTADPIPGLISGEPHAPVTFRIYEQILPSDGSAGSNDFFHFWGRVSKAVKNFDNNKDLAKLEGLTIKSQMAAPLGLTANSQCAWQWGDQNCTVTIITDSGTLTVINKNTVTITGLPGGRAAGYYEKGFVSFDGLNIGIRKWDSLAPAVFHLTNRAPLAWVGQTVVVTPGCDKTIETCRARWSNEEHFGGFGYAIPSYQPLFETASL